MAYTFSLSPSFVNGMVAGAKSPSRISTGVTAIRRMGVALGPRGKCEVHQVRYGGLTFAAAGRSYRCLRVCQVSSLKIV